ncbi:toxin [Crenothrix sp.]|uniref:toxin n=1 Tax=Crenothrix sp. TaxID=3100433 RepID=UPI00374D578B
MHFEWDEGKNKLLDANRGVCFEDVLIAISENRLLDVLPHHNPAKYPNQKLFIVQIRDYVYYVPFIENEASIFFKNIIPSRKYQKKYSGSAKHDN